MSFMANHVIHVKSCQIMSFMSNHVIHVQSCHSCHGSLVRLDLIRCLEINRLMIKFDEINRLTIKFEEINRLFD
jgi:hypothetical protein